jgi:hypothetical protein
MVEPGHSVQFYRDERFLIDSISTYIKAGLDLDETVLVIVTAQHRKELYTTLSCKELRDDKLRFLDAGDFLALFMVEGCPNESQFMHGMKTILGLVRGSARVRIFGEAVSVLCAEGNPAAALRLEGLWNIMVLEHHFSLLCAYPLSDTFEKADRDRVCQLHRDAQFQ